MTVTAASILWSLPQTDGSFNVREQLTDDSGNTYVFDYEASPDMDQNQGKRMNKSLFTNNLRQLTLEKQPKSCGQKVATACLYLV